MLHVSVTYRGRRAVGMFLEQAHWRQIVEQRTAGQPGAVPAVDAHGRATWITIGELAADPEILGVGIESLDTPMFPTTTTSAPDRRAPITPPATPPAARPAH